MRKFILVLLPLIFISCDCKKTYTLQNRSNFTATVSADGTDYKVQPHTSKDIICFYDTELSVKTDVPVYGSFDNNTYYIIEMTKYKINVHNVTSNIVSFTVTSDYDNGIISIPSSTDKVVEVYSRKLTTINSEYKFYHFEIRDNEGYLTFY